MKGIQRDLLVSNTALLLCCWSFVVSSPYQDHCITIGLYLLIACIVTLIDGFGYYRDSLPNGRRIPCDSSCSGYCEGYGHIMNDGSPTCTSGGEHPNHFLSSFGQDWQTYQTTWNLGMCMSDSDKDGASNGDEMGDPCCIWYTGGTPSRSSQLSNPAQVDASHPYPSCALAGAPSVTISTTSVTQSTVVLDWISASCICGFNISQISPKAITNQQFTLLTNYFSGGAQVQIGALDPDTQYSFEVKSYNLGGNSPFVIQIRTPAISDNAPSGPTDVKTTATTNSIKVTWTAPTTMVMGPTMPLTSGSITGYELDMAPSSTGVFNNVYAGPDAQYTITNLKPGTAYLLRVRAVSSYGVGLPSDIVNVTTPAFNGTSVSANYTSEDGLFNFGWNILGNEITCVLTGKTQGYVAVGWGHSPTMINTDIHKRIYKFVRFT